MTGRPLLPVLLLLAAAAFLRFHDLSRWSLDGDELYSHYAVLELQEGRFSDSARGYPLGFVLMAASTSLLGTGELGLRAAPALCGLLAVVALLLLRRDAVPTPVALLAGALAALSPWLVYHAQEARFYAPLLLFATLATLWALPGPGQRPFAALLAGLGAALCHPSALLALPCLLAVALQRRVSARAALLLVLAACAAGAGWLLLGEGTLPRQVQDALGRRATARYDLVHFAAGLGYALGPGTLLLALAGALVAWRAPAPGDRLLLAFAALPPALLLAVSLLSGASQQRYAMAAVPALLLLSGRGVVGLAARPALRVGLVGLALLLPVPQLLAHARDGNRSDMREAARWLAQEARPDDVFVADEHALLDLYLRRQPGFDTARTRVIEESQVTPDKRLTLVQAEPDVWVVLKQNRMAGAYPAELTAWLEQHFEELARLGPAPPPLVRHDNRLVILHRRARALVPP